MGHHLKSTILLAALFVGSCGRDDDLEIANAPVVSQPAPAPIRRDYGAGVYEPLQGDPERQLLLDQARVQVTEDLGLPVEFVIDTLRVKDDWAFAVMEPVRTGGEALTIAETRLKDSDQEYDGLRVEVLWRKTEGEWSVAQLVIGATDVWYEPFCDTAPAGVIPVCQGRAPKP